MSGMDALEYFTAEVKRERRQTRIVIVVLLFVSLGAGAWWMLGDIQGSRGAAKMLAYSMVFLVIGPIWFAATFLPHRGLAALSQPQGIVWIYGVSRGAHVTGIMVGVDTGKLAKLPVRSDHGEEALRILREVAPAATFGFAEETRKRFRANAASLRAG